ncbi:Transposase-like protein [Mycena venus]|uniref:Transposase-like protein n=1 Tax=Mycena venus TaxID=2733690 RepID=A0A8H7CUS9_9AGAR|nr:Transposase-like protein [Mycena venus]
MSATKKPMLSQTHAIFRTLQSAVKSNICNLPVPINPTQGAAQKKLRDGLVQAHLKLSEYFSRFDTSPYYLWAALLDPRISYEGLKQDYESDPTLLQSLDDAKDELYTEYTTHYAKSPSLASPGDTAASTTGPTSPSKFDFLGRYKRSNVSPTSQLKRELDKYFEMTAEPEDMETCDILRWWKNRESTFPNLYKLARDIHCIPGSAVAVERVFSCGRDTIGIRRARLKAETIRTLMLVKARVKLDRQRAVAQAQRVLKRATTDIIDLAGSDSD